MYQVVCLFYKEHKAKKKHKQMLETNVRYKSFYDEIKTKEKELKDLKESFQEEFINE